LAGTDGLGFLQVVREEYTDLPFILFTGRGSEQVAGEAVSAGVTDYL
jgi:DNA-binding NtrC family response regulator